MRLNATQRYQAWRELLDLSMQLAMAGLKAQGFSRRAAERICRQRWIRASREHHRANQRLAQQLAIRGRVPKR